MKTFLLPCSCTTEIAVTSGQAGGRVACPSCGRSLVVPKLRELSGLQELPTANEGSLAGWSPLQALALGSAALALLSLAASVLVTPRQSGVSAQAIRAATLAASDQAVYQFWKVGLAKSGVRRQPSEMERKLQQREKFFGGITRVFRGVAAVAGIASAAAFVASRRSPSAGIGGDRAGSREAVR
jgi:hypothetical protein